VLAAIDPYHHRDVPPAHWFVMVVGVAPEAQGTGIGRALLRPMIDRADAAAQPCYLETAQRTNVAFYEKLGFDRVVDTREPQSGLRLWTFRHSPLTPANRHLTRRCSQPRIVRLLSFFGFMKAICNSRGS
jgi:N-acetylglutamate synthase-like GNAT family acetyltransferase